MPAPSSPPLDYREIFYLVRERPRVVLACFGAAAVLSALVLLFSSRLYAASAVVMVEPEEQKVVDIQKVQSEDYQSLEALKTVEQTFQSRALLERVVDSNKLVENPRVMTSGAAPTRDQLVTRLAANLDVHLRRGTRLIDITVQDTDPQIASLVANSLITEFMKLDDEQGANSLHDANQFLEKEATDIKTHLDEAENALQVYKEQNQTPGAGGAQDTAVQQIDTLNAKVSEAKSQRIAAEASYRQVHALGNNVDALLLTPAAQASDEIRELKGTISKAASDFENLKLRYRPKHPKYIDAQNQLTEWKKELVTQTLALAQTTFSAYQSAAAAEQALNQALNEQQTAALEMNRTSLRFDVLSRDAESYRTLYQTVLNRIKQNSVIKDLKVSAIRVIEPAETPTSASSPRPFRVALAGALGGFLASAVSLFLLNSIDQSLKTVAQAEEFLQLPVLTAIPKFPTFNEKTLAAKGETFRTLRTALGLLELPEDRYVYLFTSSLPQEGKTFCALNYAVSLAEQGYRTLLIDGDLRRPMIGRILQPGQGRGIGLTDLLAERCELRDAAHVSQIANLSYIPAGTAESNPVELLARGVFQRLLDQALVHYDRVVIDSAPIHVVSDTLLMVGGAHAVCLVVAANQTPRHSVRRAVQMLQKAEAPITGVVFNLVPRGVAGDYYYDYSYRDRYAEPAPLREETPVELEADADGHAKMETHKEKV